MAEERLKCTAERGSNPRRVHHSLKRLVRWIGHRISHCFGLNTGQIETWWEGNRRMIGFRCSCGQLSGAHESITTANKD